MKCLDTDFLVAILRGRDDAKRKMTDLDGEGRHGTTAVNAFELFYGAHKSTQRVANIDKTRSLLGRLDVLPLEQDASEAAGEILADLTAQGVSIDFRDAMIAGIAKTNGLALVTRNRGHFSRVKNLKLESW